MEIRYQLRFDKVSNLRADLLFFPHQIRRIDYAPKIYFNLQKKL